MLAVYSPSPSSRLSYTLRVVFHEVLGIEHKELHDTLEFKAFAGPVINYSGETMENCLNISPAGLLSEQGIRPQQTDPGQWDDLPVFFTRQQGEIPFDIFSAVFYLVSRYEEYLPSEKDQYGRYRAEESLAWKGGFLNIPIIDLWCSKLAGILGIAAECPNIRPGNYRFQLSVDVDQAWLYLNKGALYSAGALIRDLVSFRLSDFSGRIRSLLHIVPDPADNFDFLQKVERKLQHPIRYFILCQQKGKYDKNRSLNTRKFRELVRRLDRTGTIGIHPSFQSFSCDSLLDNEISWLETTLGRKISSSRQHYLLFSFPETCRGLIKRGIGEDYSLGYSSRTGFRTGLARACNFYDLGNEEETTLRLVPLVVMDRTLRNYRLLTPGEAGKEYRHYTEQIRAVGGEFVCLWHNDAVSDQGEWKGWKSVFEALIENQAEK